MLVSYRVNKFQIMFTGFETGEPGPLSHHRVW